MRDLDRGNGLAACPDGLEPVAMVVGALLQVDLIRTDDRLDYPHEQSRGRARQAPAVRLKRGRQIPPCP